MRLARRWTGFRPAFVAVLLIAHAGGAQQQHGVVRDSVSHRPVPGAVLLFQDSAGRTLARTLSDQRGTYTIAVPETFRRVHVVRLGFRPREVARPAARPGFETLDVAMVPLPTILEPVQSTVAAACPRRSDREAAFALLEQARAGLLATIVAREAHPASLLRFKYTRTFDDDHIARQEVRMESTAVASISFDAVRSAADFNRLGFTAGSGMAMRFLGVDGDVLLDPRFADAYCFSVHSADRARPNQVGLDFSPARGRAGRVDIDGTVWIDTVEQRLHDIEYRYVGLGRTVEAEQPGGQTFFREMSNGVVMIDRWWLRAVVSRVDTTEQSAAPAWRPATRTRIGVALTGGELASAQWPDGASWHASLGMLVVHGVKHAQAVPPGTTARLVGTDYSAPIDTTGSFEIPNLVPGPYSLVVVDPRLSAVGAELQTSLHFAAARDSVVERVMHLPTAEEFVADRCLAARHYDVAARVYVFGRLTKASGEPVVDATVSVLREQGLGDWRPIRTRMRTDASGFFQFCEAELERGETVLLRAIDRDGVTFDQRFTLTDGLNVVSVVVRSPGRS